MRPPDARQRPSARANGAKAQRCAGGASVAFMARAAGMSRSTIYARIKDLPSCSGKEIAAIAKAARIPKDELFAAWAKAC